MFVLGFIVGLLTGYGLMAMGFYLHYRYKQPMAAVTALENLVKPRGALIDAKTDEQVARDHIKQQNDIQGQPTRLSDLK